MIDNKHSGKKVQLPEDKLLAFSFHTHTIVDFNRWLIAGSGTGFDREGLSISVTELLFDLLEQWSRGNNTFFQWTHTESKDFGNVIFIHAYYEPADVMLHIGMNEEGIYLQMTTTLPDCFLAIPYINTNIRLLQLSQLGNFEMGEDHDDFCIMWPYSCYSVTEVLTNGCIAFELMYILCRELKLAYNTIS